MLGQQQSSVKSSRLKGILSVCDTVPFTQNTHQKSIHLHDGTSLLDTEQNTRLYNGTQVLATWSTERWLLLGVSIDEKFAFFEADDSWLLARLDLETGIFKPDDDPLFIQYALESDDQGLYVLDDLSLDKYYLK